MPCPFPAEILVQEKASLNPWLPLKLKQECVLGANPWQHSCPVWQSESMSTACYPCSLLDKQAFYSNPPCLCVQFWETGLSSFPRGIMMPLRTWKNSSSQQVYHYCSCPKLWHQATFLKKTLPRHLFFVFYSILQSHPKSTSASSITAAARMGEALQASTLLHLDLKYHAQLFTPSPGNFLHLFCSG